MTRWQRWRLWWAYYLRTDIGVWAENGWKVYVHPDFAKQLWEMGPGSWYQFDVNRQGEKMEETWRRNFR